LTVQLTALAESQLAAMPAVAARRVHSALRALGAAPRSGITLEDAYPGLGACFRKTVTIRRRRWSYWIVYEVNAARVLVRFIAAPWWVRERANAK
jgi:hypothetical protein